MDNRTLDNNTYAINTGDDAIALAELHRLVKQDRFLTSRITPILPASLDSTQYYDILDAACGPAGWAMQCARALPYAHFVCVDEKDRMLQYAAGQAEARALTERLTFLRGDILKPLEFEDHSFDVVHARLLQGVMKANMWPAFVQECYRVTKPDGMIKLTEGDITSIAGAPVFHRFSRYIFQAFWQDGRSFAETESALSPMLSKFLRDAGYRDIKVSAYPIDFSTGMPLHDVVTQDFLRMFELGRPFIINYADITEEEYQAIYKQIEIELTEPINALWFFTSVEGRKLA
jgi:ubiquinone/menaquinone biosynthesis C-methylase UbiE